jgi:hypothetical protein
VLIQVGISRAIGLLQIESISCFTQCLYRFEKVDGTYNVLYFKVKSLRFMSITVKPVFILYSSNVDPRLPSSGFCFLIGPIVKFRIEHELSMDCAIFCDLPGVMDFPHHIICLASNSVLVQFSCLYWSKRVAMTALVDTVHAKSGDDGQGGGTQLKGRARRAKQEKPESLRSSLVPSHMLATDVSHVKQATRLLKGLVFCILAHTRTCWFLQALNESTSLRPKIIIIAS